MNCKQVQELLPLYVGRDLEDSRARLVTAHLQSCAECAGSAGEYHETLQLLQEFSPPQFNDAVYAEIRQHVLRDIERGATATGLSRLLENLFRPRLRWAVATALLLAVCVSAFYFIAKRANDQRDREQVAKSDGTVAGPTSSLIKKDEVVPPVGPVKNTGPVQELAGTHQSQRRKAIGSAPDRSASVDSNDARSMSAQTLRDGRSEPDAAPAGDATTSEKTLRVEMQTNDPNIRIIWFTPQPTKQDAPNKFSKGI